MKPKYEISQPYRLPYLTDYEIRIPVVKREMNKLRARVKPKPEKRPAARPRRS